MNCSNGASPPADAPTPTMGGRSAVGVAGAGAVVPVIGKYACGSDLENQRADPAAKRSRLRLTQARSGSVELPDPAGRCGPRRVMRTHLAECCSARTRSRHGAHREVESIAMTPSPPSCLPRWHPARRWGNAAHPKEKFPSRHFINAWFPPCTGAPGFPAPMCLCSIPHRKSLGFVLASPAQMRCASHQPASGHPTRKPRGSR